MGALGHLSQFCETGEGEMFSKASMLALKVGEMISRQGPAHRQFAEGWGGGEGNRGGGAGVGSRKVLLRWERFAGEAEKPKRSTAV